jgi:hypothetical protein
MIKIATPLALRSLLAHLGFIPLGAMIAPLLLAQTETKILNRMDRSDAQSKLLQFTTPHLAGPTPSRQLADALASPSTKTTSNRGVDQRVSRSTLSVIEQDASDRRIDQTVKMQVLQGLGFEVPGIQSQKSLTSMEAKIDELRLRSELRKARFLDQQNSILFSAANRRMAREAAVLAVKETENRATSVKSARLLNTLIASIGFGLNRVGAIEEIRRELEYLTLDEGDFSKIRLQFDLEGEPVIFEATKGTSDFGRPPTCLTNPRLLPHVEKVLGILKEIQNLEAGTTLYTKTIELAEALQALDDASDQVIGTARECAAKGVQSHRIWKTSQAYRNRLRGILEQLEIGDSPEILTVQSFDPQAHGNQILPFVRFVHDSGCRLAPARNGDEAVYVRLLDRLVQLQSLFEQSGIVSTTFIHESKVDEFVE